MKSSEDLLSVKILSFVVTVDCKLSQTNFNFNHVLTPSLRFFANNCMIKFCII